MVTEGLPAVPTDAAAEVSVLVVGAAGAVGGLFGRSLLGDDTVDLTALDVGEPVDLGRPITWLCGDITSPTAEIDQCLATADIIVLAVPELVAEKSAEHLLATVRRDALIVDTLSVKSGWFDRIRRPDPGPELLSVTPMFAPQLGFARRPVAVIDLRVGPRSAWFRRRLQAWGSELVAVGPEEHDRVTASLQVATHAAVLAFGLALVDLGHDIDRFAPLFTPPHRTMLALVARIVGGDDHVYHDIQHANPHADEARAALCAGLQRVADAAATSDTVRFGEMTRELSALLGVRQAELEELCAEVFSQT